MQFEIIPGEDEYRKLLGLRQGLPGQIAATNLRVHRAAGYLGDLRTSSSEEPPLKRKDARSTRGNLAQAAHLFSDRLTRCLVFRFDIGNHLIGRLQILTGFSRGRFAATAGLAQTTASLCSD